MRVASTAVSIVPWPDIITTGIVSCPDAPHSRSSVTPSVSGIQMSSSTSAGCCRARYARASMRVLGERDAIALVLQDLGEQLADADLVVDDQDVLRRGDGHRVASGKVSVTRAPPRAVVDGDAPAVLVDDLLHDREPESGALGLGGHVGFERARDDVGRKALAGVLEDEARLAGVPGEADRVARRLGARLGVDRILHEIVEHLAEAGGLALDHDGAVGEGQRGMRPQIVVQSEHVEQEARQIDRLQLAGPGRAGIDREVVDHLLHRLHLVHDRRRAALHRFRVRRRRGVPPA